MSTEKGAPAEFASAIEDFNKRGDDLLLLAWSIVNFKSATRAWLTDLNYESFTLKTVYKDNEKNEFIPIDKIYQFHKKLQSRDEVLKTMEKLIAKSKFVHWPPGPPPTIAVTLMTILFLGAIPNSMLQSPFLTYLYIFHDRLIQYVFKSHTTAMYIFIGALLLHVFEIIYVTHSFRKWIPKHFLALLSWLVPIFLFGIPFTSRVALLNNAKKASEATLPEEFIPVLETQKKKQK
jgi:hypothetical protein